MYKLLKISTIPESLNILLKGQLKYLSQFFDITAVSGSNSSLEELEQRENVKVFPVEMERKIAPLSDLISLVKLYKCFKKENPMIIHSITPKAGLLSMLAGKMAGVPIRVHTYTGLIFPTKKGMMQQLLIRMDQLLCWSATNIYPEGKGVQNDLINFKITNKPLKVIANGNVNGIDLEHYTVDHFGKIYVDRLKKELNINNDDFIFIFVGRLVGDKGINELIEAYSIVRNPNTKLLLVGLFEHSLDPLKNKTLQKISDFKDIISTGFQKDVRPYFAISNALVFPSYREGFPNVVMQAGAMGLPSIVSNINGCNEIILEGKNGMIVDARNAIKLAEAMEMLLTNKSRYDYMKANSRKMIADRYDQSVVWNALVKEYNLLLEQKK